MLGDGLINDGSTRVRLAVLMAGDRIDEYLMPAIQSILTQTMSEFVLYLVDNSSDGRFSEFVAARISDTRIQFVRAKLRQLPFALNAGLQKINCEFVARMDCDDIALPTRFQVQLDYLDRNPEVAVVGGQYVFIDSYGREISSPSVLPTDAGEVRRRQYWEGVLCHPAVMFRRVRVVAVGGYIGGRRAQDLDLWLRLRRGHEMMCNVDSVVLHYRRHPSQDTARQHIAEVTAEVAGFYFREFLFSSNPLFLLGVTRAILLGLRSRFRVNLGKLLSRFG